VVVLGLRAAATRGDKGAGEFADAFKGGGWGYQEEAYSGKAGEDHGGRCAAGAARRKKGKKKKALPSGVGASEEERGSARSEEVGQRGKEVMGRAKQATGGKREELGHVREREPAREEKRKEQAGLG
jgi:hypothetical protein